MRPASAVIRTLVCAVVSALICHPALAQWKWRDARGNITVSDLPPPRGIPDDHILQRPEVPVRATPPPAAASAAVPAPSPVASAPVDPELQARKKAADDEKAAQANADEEKRAQLRQQNCRNARSHLTAMESGQRITRMNDKGEREFLDDRQREDEAQRARSVIQSDCE